MAESDIIRRRAIRVDQDKNHPLFLFSLTGEEILSLADISRVSRDDAGKLLGYQRPEVKRHIEDIVEYLESDSPIFTNSLIFALSSEVTFKEARGPKVDTLTTAGTLEIPVPKKGQPKPAWIVDGQQRALAISKSKRKNFPVPVSAFIADELNIQRDQFLRINNAKPLPRGLISELLPEVDTPLPLKLAARKVPAALCHHLNSMPGSPFLGLIKRPSNTPEQRKSAVITDTAIIKMLEESIMQGSGCLFPHRSVATGQTDTETILKILFCYWGTVKELFPKAWGLPPTKSRLMHGVGIRSMGRLMDKVMSGLSVYDNGAEEQVRSDLQLLVPHVHWTSGRWHEELGSLSWNELQNVPRHITGLSSFLIRTYLREKGLLQ